MWDLTVLRPEGALCLNKIEPLLCFDMEKAALLPLSTPALDTLDPYEENCVFELLPTWWSFREAMDCITQTTLKAGPSKSVLLSFFFLIRLQNQLMNELISLVCCRMTQSGSGVAGLSSSGTGFNQSSLVFILGRRATSVSSESEIFTSSGIGTSSTGCSE
ncbi:hypothetical protein Tco_0633163 [Tanacetum coccineum]